jgi:hypothetical protein
MSVDVVCTICMVQTGQEIEKAGRVVKFIKGRNLFIPFWLTVEPLQSVHHASTLGVHMDQQSQSSGALNVSNRPGKKKVKEHIKYT